MEDMKESPSWYSENREYMSNPIKESILMIDNCVLINLSNRSKAILESPSWYSENREYMSNPVLDISIEDIKKVSNDRSKDNSR